MTNKNEIKRVLMLFIPMMIAFAGTFGFTLYLADIGAIHVGSPLIASLTASIITAVFGFVLALILDRKEAITDAGKILDESTQSFFADDERKFGTFAAAFRDGNIAREYILVLTSRKIWFFGPGENKETVIKPMASVPLQAINKIEVRLGKEMAFFKLLMKKEEADEVEFGLPIQLKDYFLKLAIYAIQGQEGENID